jgi:hypothetical protein
VCPFSHFLPQNASFWRLYHPTRAPNIRIMFSISYFCNPFSSTCNNFRSFFEKMLPASAGITFCKSTRVHFDSKNQPSGPSGGGKATDVGNCFTPSASFSLLFHHKCLLWAAFSPEVRHVGDFFNTPGPPTYALHVPAAPLLDPSSTTCYIFHSFFEKVLPAVAGTTFLQFNPVHSGSKTAPSGPPGGGKTTDVGNCFAPSASF